MLNRIFYLTLYKETMKTIKLIFLIKILIIGIFTFYLDGFSQSKSCIGLPDNKMLPVIELKGNGYERGLQHGKQLKSEIAEIIKNAVKTNVKINPFDFELIIIYYFIVIESSIFF